MLLHVSARWFHWPDQLWQPDVRWFDMLHVLCDCAATVCWGSMCTGSCTLQVMELEEAEVHAIWQAVAAHTPQRSATINQMHACLEVGLMLSGCCPHRSIASLGTRAEQ